MNDAAGPRPGREPESASFDVARVGPPRRGRQPVIVLGFVGLLAAVVSIGVGGRTPPAPTAPPRAAAVSPSPTEATPTDAPATQAPTRTPTPTRSLVIAGIGGPIELRIRRPVASIFVHGDVFSPGVTWVYISLQDATGDVQGFASVSVPGAAGPRASDGPTLRFDIDVAIPPELVDQDVWVQVIAYGVAGSVVGTTRVGIRPDGGPVNGPQGFPVSPTR